MQSDKRLAAIESALLQSLDQTRDAVNASKALKAILHSLVDCIATSDPEQGLHWINDVEQMASHNISLSHAGGGYELANIGGLDSLTADVPEENLELVEQKIREFFFPLRRTYENALME